MGKTEFEQTHIVRYTQNYGANYQVPAPTLSANYLCPVYYGVKGESKTFAPSIDYALKQMKDETAKYQIELYPETPATASATRKVYPQDATFTAKYFPKVALLEFVGKNIYLSESSYIQCKMTVRNSVTLYSNVNLINVTLVNDKNINKNGYTITKKTQK
jgi:hypothetical protein